MTELKTIDTAPTDGTRFLGIAKHDVGNDDGFDPLGYAVAYGEICEAEDGMDEYSYFCSDTNDDVFAEGYLTHWTPLPSVE